MRVVKKNRHRPVPCVHREVEQVGVETRMVERYQSHGDKYPKLIRMSLPRLKFMETSNSSGT